MAMNEKRLIDANKAKFFIADILDIFGVPVGDRMANKLMETIDALPTVDAVEVVHGRWIKDGDVVVCSNCGEEHAWDEYRATYCEDCGAKMDGGNEDG